MLDAQRKRVRLFVKQVCLTWGSPVISAQDCASKLLEIACAQARRNLKGAA